MPRPTKRLITRSMLGAIIAGTCLAGTSPVALGAHDHARRRGPHPAGCDCCAPRVAGTLRINDRTFRIGIQHPYRRIADSFRRAGYHAYVRTDCGVTSVRIYGYPEFCWTPGLYDTHTKRSGSVLQINLCTVGR